VHNDTPVGHFCDHPNRDLTAGVGTIGEHRQYEARRRGEVRVFISPVRSAIITRGKTRNIIRILAPRTWTTHTYTERELATEVVVNKMFRYQRNNLPHDVGFYMKVSSK